MNHPVLATDIVVFNIRKGELKVLLIKMNKEPFIWKWAIPWGFILENELCENEANRILFETTNVNDLYLEQLKVFDNPKRDPKMRVISIAYMAIIKKDDLNIKTNERYTDINWFWVDDLPDLAYDHYEIIKYWLERLISKIKYSTIILSLMPDTFTLTELQKVFEIVLKKELDKRNFRKKILKLWILEDTWKKRIIWLPKPAIMYKAINKELEFIEMI